MTKKGKVFAHPVDRAEIRTWDDEDDEFSRMLSRCTLIPTRMAHKQTLLDLGLREDYYALMNSMVMGNLPRM